MIQDPQELTYFQQWVIVMRQIKKITFYDYATTTKQANPAIDFKSLLEYPARKNCGSKLWGAYGIFKNLYPNVDKATHDAVERRLGEFDII